MGQGANLWVTTREGPREFDQERVVVGRDRACDVVVADPRASRHHLTLERHAGTWTAVDTSSGGTYAPSGRIDRLPVGDRPLSLRLGGPDGEQVEVWVVVPPAATSAPAAPHRATPPPVPHHPPPPAQPFPPPPVQPYPPPQQQYPPPPVQPYPPPPHGAPQRATLPWQGGPVPPSAAPQHVLPPGQLAHGQTVFPAQVTPGRALTIGRDLSNDIVLDDPLVSRFHGRLDLAPQPVLHDLGSFNGSFVNGHRVVGAAPLLAGQRGDRRQPDLPLGRRPAGLLGHHPRVHAVRRRALGGGEGRPAAAGERLLPARPVQPHRGDRPVGRRQVDAARRPHRAAARHPRPRDLAGPRPLRRTTTSCGSRSAWCPSRTSSTRSSR